MNDELKQQIEELRQKIEYENNQTINKFKQMNDELKQQMRDELKQTNELIIKDMQGLLNSFIKNSNSNNDRC